MAMRIIVCRGRRGRRMLFARIFRGDRGERGMVFPRGKGMKWLQQFSCTCDDQEMGRGWNYPHEEGRSEALYLNT